jgi:hypothetical protein
VHVVWNGRCDVHNVDYVGTVPAALSAYLATQHFNPDLIISAGTAGGFKARVRRQLAPQCVVCVGWRLWGRRAAVHDGIMQQRAAASAHSAAASGCSLVSDLAVPAALQRWCSLAAVAWRCVSVQSGTCCVVAAHSAWCIPAVRAAATAAACSWSCTQRAWQHGMDHLLLFP